MSGLMIQGTDWAVERIVSVTDGDTVRIVRSRTFDVDSELEATVRDRNPKGAAIRLVNLDTPERGEAGYTEARADLEAWLSDHRWVSAWRTDLRVITYPGGGFDRLLGDIYVNGDIGNTASQHMLRDKNWPPYVRGK